LSQNLVLKGIEVCLGCNLEKKERRQALYLKTPC